MIWTTLTRAAMGAACLAVSAGLAAAQTESAPPPPVLVFRDSVVVTAERGKAPQNWIPAATVAIDARSLGEWPAVSVGELLTFLPGFRVQQSAFHAGRPVVSARGFFGGGEAEYVALLVDGVRIADAESGLIDWSTVSSSTLTRIEAARGPGASLYGDAAIGGVIQVLTDSSSSRDVITMSGGSLGTVVLDGTWRWRKDAMGGFVAGAARRTNGISAHSDASELSLGGAVDGKAGALSWRWTANVLGRDQEEPGSIALSARERGADFDPSFSFDDRHRRTLLTAFSLRGAGGAWTQQSRVSVNVREEDGVRTMLLAPGLGDTRHRDLSAAGIAGTFEVERPLGTVPNSAIRLGVDLERQHLETTYANVRDGEPTDQIVGSAAGARVRAGAFASTSWMPAPAVRLFGALRWDRIADGDFGRSDSTEPTHAWSPRAGIVVQPERFGGASLFAQYSRAFKAPTLDQMFDPRPYPDFRGGTFTISNALLTAQRASNIETGASGGSRVRWSVLAYRMNVENEIDFDARTFSYANIGRSRHIGLEVEVQGSASSRVRPIASYALSEVTSLDAEVRRQLKNVPRHQVMVGATAAGPLKLHVFAATRRTWDAYLDDENSMATPAGVLVDLRVRRAIGPADVCVDVMNALDRRYDEFGFVLAEFRGGSVPYVYPGQPRVFRVGLTLGAR